MTEYNNGGYIPGPPIEVRLTRGEKIIKPDGTVIDPFAGGGDTIPAFLSEGCAYLVGNHGSVSQETLDMLNRTTSTVVTSEYNVEFDEED